MIWTVVRSGLVLQADHIARCPRNAVERFPGGLLQFAKGGVEGAEVGFMAHEANVHQFLGLGVRGGAQDERLDYAEKDVFVPIAMARRTTATAAKPGAPVTLRPPDLMSCSSSLVQWAWQHAWARLPVRR